MKTIFISIGTLVLIGGSVYAYLHWAEVKATANKLGVALDAIAGITGSGNPAVTGANVNAAPTPDAVFKSEAAKAKSDVRTYQNAGTLPLSLTEMDNIIDSLGNSREKIMNASLTYVIPISTILLYLANHIYVNKYGSSPLNLTALSQYNLSRLDTPLFEKADSGRG